MRDDLTADERQVAEMLSSVGPPRQQRPGSGPKRQTVRWPTALGIAALVVVVLAGAVVLPRTLRHQSAHMPAQSTASPSTPAAAPARYLGAGAQLDAGQDEWVLGHSGLAVTRDGGAQWSQLPLPPTALTIYTVAVLPSETVVVSSPNPLVSVTVDVALNGSSTWETTVVPFGVVGQVGSLEVVDSDGTLEGIMIELTTSVQFSQGVWLASPDESSGWRAYPTPVGGTVTAVGGELWLVGGVQDQDVYSSSDEGTTWIEVTLPVTLGTAIAYGPVQAEGNRVVLTASLSNSDETQVLIGSKAASGWQWSAGTVINVGGQFGPGGRPQSSVAGGVLWILGFSDRISLVNLASGSVSQITPHGMPALISNYSIAAASSMSAVVTYSGFDCPNGKASCTPGSGVVSTSDGGAYWTPIADPFPK